MASVNGRNVPNKDVVVVRKEKGEVIILGNLRLDVLEDGSNTDNRIGATMITIPPNSAGPPQHWHQMHDETFLVTSGAVTFTSREKNITLHAGDYIVVPTMSPHTFGNEGNEVATMYTSYTPAFYVNYFRVMAKMIEDNGGKMTPEIGTEAMLRYGTLQTKRMGEPY